MGSEGFEFDLMDEQRFEYDLTESEYVWRDHYHFLRQRGYQLRPRYEPGWIGSWLTNGKHILQCEDRLHISEKSVLDAIRLSDGVKVALKHVNTYDEEIPIGLYLSSNILRSDPRNRCVPIIDVIPIPANDDFAFIVMPFLRIFDEPPFRRKVECIEAFRQMLEGLAFMHEHNVAHRDACFFNFVMDATKLVPGGYHHSLQSTYDGIHQITQYKNRKSVGPMKYYWIDFGLSTRFPSLEERSLVYGKVGQERNVPEMSWDVPYDAFKSDIFQVGMVMKRLCTEYEGLEFVQPLIDHLLQEDPQRRPSASEALLKLEGIVKSMSRRKLNGFVIHLQASNKSEKKSRLRRKKLSAWKMRQLNTLLKINRVL